MHNIAQLQTSFESQKLILFNQSLRKHLKTPRTRGKIGEELLQKVHKIRVQSEREPIINQAQLFKENKNSAWYGGQDCEDPSNEKDRSPEELWKTPTVLIFLQATTRRAKKKPPWAPSLWQAFQKKRKQISSTPSLKEDKLGKG